MSTELTKAVLHINMQIDSTILSQAKLCEISLNDSSELIKVFL